MDFQSLVDAMFSPTCVFSVAKPDKDNEKYGEIRIVSGNRKFIETLELREKNLPTHDPSDDSFSFIPDSIYTKYLPQSTSLEDVCYRAAILKEEVHTYAYIHNLALWIDIYSFPIEDRDEDKSYCVYIATPSNNPELILDRSGNSRTSNDVLKACIKLHKAGNLKEALGNVISEIRHICDAEGCTVLLINYEDEEYSILASDFDKNSTIRRVTSFPGYYVIASSWKDMLGEEGDCIIIKDEVDMERISKLNHPWYQTLVEAGVDSVVLFPLRQGTEILGFMWAVNFDTDKTRTIKETLQLTTFFISAHTAHYKAMERLRKFSYTDVLTGLPNRFASTEYISGLMTQNKTFSIVSIDLNNFKSINDTLGFEAGNHVLKKLGSRWHKVSVEIPEPLNVYVARSDGDEFFLVIDGYRTSDELEAAIQRFVDVLGKSISVDDCDLHVSASFGYAEYPADADTADALISHANAAMNEIKEANSSDHVLRFSPDILKDEHILEIENMIRSALENDTFFVNLQPQYDMDHRLRGFEALARMKDSDGNVISPVEFIPVAEKVGLIDRLDSVIFRKAALFFGDILQKTNAELTLSINASVRHLMKNDFLDEIQDLLKISGIPAHRLEIEITESIMIDSAEKALSCIDSLREMGIQIAIDDFGTGYSSLSYLNKFPANLLKIDKSFIDTMNTSDSARQYVAAIISLGHIMGFDVISEGIEDDDQLETLKEIHCDFVQGFFWGRPLSTEDAEKLVLSEV